MLMLVKPVCAFAQLMKPDIGVKRDSVFIKGDRFLFCNDHVYYIENDTFLIVTDTTDFYIKKNPAERTQAFYDSVETKMSKAAVSRMVYNTIFRRNDHHKVYNDDISEFRFNPYEGKIINPMEYKSLDIFGTSINDTSKYKVNDFNHFLNKAHIHTNRVVIRRSLTFRRNDSLSAIGFIDSERLLRSRNYIRDARIMLNETNTPDSVEVIVVTKDVFPYTVSYRPNNGNSALFGVSTVNLFGLGHGLEYNFIRNGRHELFYSIRNIGGSFADIFLNYANYFGKTGFGIIYDKQFLTVDTKGAGGLEYSIYRYANNEYDLNTEVRTDILYSVDRKSAWYGRAFDTNIDLIKYGFQSRKQFIVAAKFDLQDYFDKPLVTADSNYFYHDRNDYLLEVGFSSRLYHQDKYIVNFGRTEDIPTGTSIQATIGYQDREFDNRLYLGGRYTRGGYISGVGYLNTFYSAGLFFEKNEIEDLTINIGADYFTSLQRLGRMRLRQFVSSNLSTTFKPSTDYYLSGQGDIGIRGVSGYYLKATSLLSLNLESVFFTPKDILGFKVAFYFFLDGTATINSFDVEFKPDIYSGIGGGLRFRNDNLAFPSINIRLAYYPNVPFRANPGYGDLSTNDRLNIRDFSIGEPEIEGFR